MTNRRLSFEATAAELQGYHKVALDLYLMNFLFQEKIMFRSRDIEMFVFF